VVAPTAELYPGLVLGELRKVTPPADGPRRHGARDKAGPGIQAITEDLTSVVQSRADGRRSEQDALSAATDLALETTCLLYDTGAVHVVWRHWSALAGLGMTLMGDLSACCAYLVLAGEWAAIAALASGPPVGSSSTSISALWQLASGQRGRAHELDLIAEIERPWAVLMDAIPEGDGRRIESGLRDLADFWIGEDEEWNEFRSRTYPSFHPEVCAAAAVARHRGYMPQHLPEDTLQFLEPGLARPEPVPLFDEAVLAAIVQDRQP
jgi:hypothetical protein